MLKLMITLTLRQFLKLKEMSKSEFFETYCKDCTAWKNSDCGGAIIGCGVLGCKLYRDIWPTNDINLNKKYD